MDRRTALKTLAAGALAGTVGVEPSFAREPKTVPADAVGMLYDATRCIGCQACVVACKRANDLPADTSSSLGNLYDAPLDLNATTKNIIKLARQDGRDSFVKRQCMHCIDPACVSVCMMGAMSKNKWGVVTHDVSRCIGCRYCQVACQFTVPKFQWNSPTPKIIKCEMCYHLLVNGGTPACCEVCPVEAVIFGKYTDLLADARARIAGEPEHYEEKIYGEKEAGGTQVLYLTAKGFDFDAMGLPDLDEEPVPELAETIQHGVYRGFIAPAALYAALGVVLLQRQRRMAGLGKDEPAEETSS